MADSAHEELLAPDGLGADDDYLTVAMLAAGLAGILGRRARAGQDRSRSEGLLPGSWRVAFARLWWRCLEQGVEGPDSDLDLLALCSRPFVTWPVRLSLSWSDMESCLLAGDELSVFGEQGARLAVGDVEAEWTENRVYQALRTAASANGGGDDGEVERVYAVLRRRLIDYPVLADLELKRWEREFGKADGSGQTYVKRLIDAAYVSRPASGEEQYLRCPQCRNTLPGAEGPCGTPGCAGGTAEDVSVSALAALYEQHRATRRFIHDPGLVEARIFDALGSRKDLAGCVRVTPYPGLDTLDVLIEFLAVVDGCPAVIERWGADAKDQDSARLLARAFTWPESVPCQRRFLVLPEHRMTQPGYAADLRSELDGRVDRVEVIGERRLVSLVTSKAMGLVR